MAIYRSFDIQDFVCPVPVPTRRRRKTNKGVAPYCFSPSFFNGNTCPQVFDYKSNNKIVRLYRIQDTCCYTPNPNK